MSISTALKGGVDIRGICPEMVLGVVIVSSVYEAHGIPLVLTSVRDGRHAVANSLHYVGSACDLRLPSRYTANPATDKKIAAELKEALGQQFDVVLEGDHIHVEFDPK